MEFLALQSLGFPSLLSTATVGDGAQIDWKTLGLLIGIILSWTAAFLWAVKVMLNRESKLIDSQFVTLTGNLTQITDRQQELEKDLLRLRAELSEKYVHREDWIRFGVAIDRKLDLIWKKLDRLKESANGN